MFCRSRCFLFRLRFPHTSLPSTSAAFCHLKIPSRCCHGGSLLTDVISGKHIKTEDEKNSNAVIEMRNNPPTRSEITQFLRENALPYEITKYTSHVCVDCDICGGPKSTYISSTDGTVSCIACHDTDNYINYKKRVLVNRTEQCCEETVTRKDEKIIEETFNMESPDEMDNDLYDKVSYLNLMDDFKNTETKKRQERLDNLRRLRDDADTLSPRGEETTTKPSVMASQSTVVDPAIRQFWAESMDVHEMNTLEQSDMLQLRTMLGIDRIKLDTLSRFNVRGHTDSYEQMAIMYPRYRGSTTKLRAPTGLKLIRRVGDKLEKENYPDEGDGKRFTGIFGYHMTTASDRRVILTTNERDALAVYEATGGMLTFALPQGERLDMNIVPYLEDFDTVYLWFPHRHIDYAKDYAHVLNPARCLLIKSPDRPIELLRNDQKKDINLIIREQACRLRDTGFRSLLDIRQDVRNELLNSKSRSVGLCQFKRFDVLNRYMVGFRPAELTVVTGGTGFGKTTFVCEYALDLLTQGVRTLFCSFEMPEEKILKWMLIQFAGIPLHRVEHHPAVETWLDRFERNKGALTIMKSEEFRDKTINQIASAIKNEIVNTGVQHVVIDNLQFLVGLATLHDEKSSSIDRFNLQDRFVGLIRRIATDYGVHVTMVVHPRKTEGDTDLDVQHFGGSARVTQEADNVFAIQRRRDETRKGGYRKFLYILKNRYGARKVEADVIEMVFQPATYSHTLIDHSARL